MYFRLLFLLFILVAAALGNADDSPIQRLVFYEGGLFSNKADCLAVLPAQEKLFHDQTGLTPLSVNCVQNSDPQDEGLRFSPEIDFTGTPNKYLYFADTFTILSLPNNTESMALLHQLVQEVGTIAIETQDEIAYYRSEPPEISNILPAIFDDPSQCASQLNAVRSAYVQGGVTDVIPNCFMDKISGSYLFLIAWTSENTSVAENHATNSALYPNFQSCMEAKDAAIVQKRTALPSGKHIWGGLCEPHVDDARTAQDGFVLDLFTDDF